MCNELNLLTDREKDVLRLLLAGHDAKSCARVLEVSVHTVNERLRESRRKLGVSSSREAARMLAGSEQQSHNSFGYKDFGVESAVPNMTSQTPAKRPFRRTAVFWIFGGLMVMSVLIAAALLVLGTTNPVAPASSPAVDAAVGAAAQSDARRWLALVDSGKWSESRDQAASMFKTQVTAEKWTALVEPIREKLGQQLSRTLKSAQRASTLPGAPDGDYVILQFTTGFAAMKDTTETVIMTREGDDWKVAGYFIRPA